VTGQDLAGAARQVVTRSRAIEEIMTIDGPINEPIHLFEEGMIGRL
jgi:hypothetical protein